MRPRYKCSKERPYFFLQNILCDTLEIKVYQTHRCMQMFSSSLSFVLINYICTLCPSLPMKASFVFFPLLVLGLSTGIRNDTCWWKQGENTSADLFCCMSVMSLLALDLVVCICLMKRGCFNLLDCPSLRSISFLLEIESWHSNVPVITVIITVPPQQRVI